MFLQPEWAFAKRERTTCLQSKYELVISSVNFVLKGKGSLRYFASKSWNLLPVGIRENHSVLPFITKIKQLKAIVCSCTICKSWLRRIGYVKVSDYQSIIITVSRYLVKQLKILRNFGISVLSTFNVYAAYLMQTYRFRTNLWLCNVYFRCFYSRNGPSV